MQFDLDQRQQQRGIVAGRLAIEESRARFEVARRDRRLGQERAPVRVERD